MTSSDDFLHLWEIDEPSTEESWELTEVMSIRFTPMETFGYGVTVCRITGKGLDIPGGWSSSRASPGGDGGVGYGGERNPDNLVFVFDASYCPSSGLLGAALSDGSVRLMNGRGVCVSILTLPGCQSHMTSFSWDSSGTRLASCVATGHLILWEIDLAGYSYRGSVTPACMAVLEGGHQVGRPLFGAQYCGGKEEELLVSWGIDGRLCLWDSRSQGNIGAPLNTLVAKNDDYPIYAIDMFHGGNNNDNNNNKEVSRMAVGGGREGGFLGIPLYLYDITTKMTTTASTTRTTK